MSIVIKWSILTDLNCCRSTPAELFYDFIEDLEEKYQKDKKKIKELMEESSINIDSHTNFDEWRTKVNKTSHDNEKFQSITIDPSHLRILFDEVSHFTIFSHNSCRFLVPTCDY